MGKIIDMSVAQRVAVFCYPIRMYTLAGVEIREKARNKNETIMTQIIVRCLPYISFHCSILFILIDFLGIHSLCERGSLSLSLFTLFAFIRLNLDWTFFSSFSLSQSRDKEKGLLLCLRRKKKKVDKFVYKFIDCFAKKCEK